MRVVKRVVVYPSGFSFQAKPAREAQRSGAESRALAVGFPIQPEPVFLSGLRPVILSLKASGLLFFCSCVLFARREFGCLPDRCRRFVLCWQLAPHTSSYPDS